MFGARNDALAMRKKQVATLGQYFQGTVREVQPDVLYEIPVAAPGRILVRVTVSLPEQFPYHPPVIHCVPAVPTPHMDMSGYIKPSANESLSRWNVQNSLGKLVYEVIANVIAPATPAAMPSNGHASNAPTTGPPPPQSAPQLSYGTGPQSSTAMQPMQPSVSAPAINTAANSAPRKAAAAAHDNDMPSIPTSFPELETKSLEELQQIASSEDHLMLFLEDVEFYKGLRKVRDSAREATAAQAQKNLDRRDDLERFRARLQTAVAELEDAKRQYDERLAAQRSMMQSFSVSSLVGMLQAETKAVDKYSDEQSRAFLAGSVPFKEFLASYLEKRTLYHLRASKLEAIQKSI